MSGWTIRSNLIRRSEEMPTTIERFERTVQEKAADYGIQPSGEAIAGLSNYYELLMKWNDRLHLVAPCSPREFATRHVLESLMLLPYLLLNARIIDVGSGAGLPIIPCLIVRGDIRATLIESSSKKGVFLREALRVLNCQNQAQVVVEQFQDTVTAEADYVTCRALDRFRKLLPTLIEWSPPASTLLLFVGESLRDEIQANIPLAKSERIPNSQRRFLIVAPRGRDVL